MILSAVSDHLGSIGVVDILTNLEMIPLGNFQATLEAINLAVDCIYKTDSVNLDEKKVALQK